MDVVSVTRLKRTKGAFLKVKYLTLTNTNKRQTKKLTNCAV